MKVCNCPYIVPNCFVCTKLPVKINIDKYMGMKIQITNGDSFVCFSDPRDEFLRRISEKYNKKNEK